MKWAVLACFLLAGCATEPDDYMGPPEAVSRALAACRVQSDAIPATTNAAANPLFAAASQQQYVVDCMAAKGFRAR
jgi:hypothetical protein